jgi:hypothetical protein
MEASLIAFNASSIAQNDRDFASRQVLAAESSSCQTSWEKTQTRRAERCWVHYAEETSNLELSRFRAVGKTSRQGTTCLTSCGPCIPPTKVS